MTDAMLTLFGKYAVRDSAIEAMEGCDGEPGIEVLTLGGAPVRTVGESEPYVVIHLSGGRSLCIEGRTLDEVMDELAARRRDLLVPVGVPEYLTDPY